MARPVGRIALPEVLGAVGTLYRLKLGAFFGGGDSQEFISDRDAHGWLLSVFIFISYFS